MSATPVMVPIGEPSGIMETPSEKIKNDVKKMISDLDAALVRMSQVDAMGAYIKKADADDVLLDARNSLLELLAKL